MDESLKNHLRQAMESVDDRGTHGPRLLEEAERLWKRVQELMEFELAGRLMAPDAMELACYAIQLPLKHGKGTNGGKLGRTPLPERCEQAVEMLVNIAEGKAADGLMEGTIRILKEMPARSPKLAEARLLADMVNLDDFGVTGLLGQMIQLTRQGDGLGQLINGAEKREQYGYWDARLKDGFHFEPVREMARQRLENSRKMMAMLKNELMTSNQSPPRSRPHEE